MPRPTLLRTTLLTLAISGVPIATAFAAPEPRVAPESRPRIEVAFVLDTTGSMSGLIEGAKRKIWSIASRIAQGKPTPILRVGLVGYRDRGDEYVTRAFDLTDNLDQVFEHLQGLSAAGGGDTPEHVGQALGEAVRDFSWSSDARTLKMIFLVGDAPPQLYGDGWDYREWARKAIAKGIMVNTVRCGGYAPTAEAFREIARLADGQFMSIDGSGGMVATATPFDARIAEVSRKISETAVFVGDGAARERAEVAKQALDAMGAEATSDRAGYMAAKAASSGGSVAAAAAPSASGARDLVSEPAAAVADLDEAQLPSDLARLSKAERVARVEKLRVERAALERELVELTRQRADHLAKHVEKEDSFDGAVMKEVRTRAARIGVAY